MHASAGPALPIKSCTHADFGVVADSPVCFYRRAIKAHTYFPWAYMLPGDYRGFTIDSISIYGLPLDWASFASRYSSIQASMGPYAACRICSAPGVR